MRKSTVWALWAAAIIISLFSLVFRTLNTRELASNYSGATWLMEMLYWSVLIPLTVPAFATTGAWIATRKPTHPVGWLCLAMALVVGLQDALWQVAMRAFVVSPGNFPTSAWMAWTLNIFTALEQPPLPLMLLLMRFPTGSLPSRGWRYVEGAVSTAAGVQVLLSSFMPTLWVGEKTIPNPVGINVLDMALPWMNQVVSPIGYALLLVSLAAPYFHWRRAGRNMRQQMKWLVFTSGIILMTALLAWAASLLAPANPYPAVILGAFAVGGASVGIPVTIGVAILKHRLYDIDLIINRSLVYLLLSLSVIGVYVLVVGYLSELLRTSGSLWISLIATGIVAVIFQPLREFFQRRVNRLVYGERDDPYLVLSHFSQRLETAITPEAILPSIVETVAQALKLPYVAIELVTSGEAIPPAAVYPLHLTGSPPRNTLRLPLVYQKEMVGYLLLAPRTSEDGFTATEQSLLAAIGRQAGVAANAVRLSSELQHSRQKLVALREEERRRIRRDLHDGLGPQLAALLLQAGTIRTLLRWDTEAADTAVMELRQEIQAAIADIRSLVYELRPPSLDELGLVGAVRRQIDQAEKGGLLIAFKAPDHLPQLPAAVEVAAFRIIQESLTNTVRHAKSRNCCISIALHPASIGSGVSSGNGASLPGQPAWLELEVKDDGCGIREGSIRGVGLTSMRERAEELGGTFWVEAADTGEGREPRGTRVLARLPVFPLETMLEKEKNNGTNQQPAS